MEREHTVTLGGRHGRQAGRREAGRHDDERHPPARPAHHAFEKRVEGLIAQLERLGDVVTQLHRDGAQQHGQLLTGLKEAQSSTRALAETTGHLREALASPKARGQWGERMADDVLRHAGMVEGVTYRKQTGIAGRRDPRRHLPAARRARPPHGREVPGRQLPPPPRGRHRRRARRRTPRPSSATSAAG